MNSIFDKVYSFYTHDLIYHEEFMPKSGDLNQVYYPYCKHTLNKDAFLDWFNAQDQTPEFVEKVKDSLFNKDLKEVFNV
jgi:hypothetical protein